MNSVRADGIHGPEKVQKDMSKNPKKILVVDDEPDVREMTQRKLERAGYTVWSAANGLEALGIIAKEPPDLIVLDVVMPQMDGYSFYKEIKQYELLAKIPVIILTARAKMEDSFIALGAQEFIPKPFNPEQLLFKVDNLLAKKKADGQVASERDPGLREGHPNLFMAGNDPAVVEKITALLRNQNCRVEGITDGKELIAKALAFVPKAIFIDVRLKTMAAEEVIKSLRSLSAFKETFILTYCCLDYGEEKQGFADEAHLQMEEKRKACDSVGANDFLGIVTETTFLDVVLNYLNQNAIR